MQLNPLSIEPGRGGDRDRPEARALRGGRPTWSRRAVDRQPENPDVWLRAYAVQHFVDDAPARIASVRRLLELDPHEDRVPFDSVAGDVAAQSASATGTPLVVEVLPAPAPADRAARAGRAAADRPAAAGVGRRRDRRAAADVSEETPASAPARP